LFQLKQILHYTLANSTLITRTVEELIHLHFQGLVPTTVFKERLDFDTLENVGLISSRQQYQGY
jgi:hypothetical protein